MSGGEMRILNQKSFVLNAAPGLDFLLEVTFSESDDGTQLVVLKKETRKNGERVGGIDIETHYLDKK